MDTLQGLETKFRVNSLVADTQHLLGNTTEITLRNSDGVYGVPELLAWPIPGGVKSITDYRLDTKLLSGGMFGPWGDGYIAPVSNQNWKDAATISDYVGATANALKISREFPARLKAAELVSRSLDQRVNVTRAQYLVNGSTDLLKTANTYGPKTNAKSFQVLSQLVGSNSYSAISTSTKYLPGVYAGLQLGSEVYYAQQNNLSAETYARNVGSRALGTGVELYGAGAAFTAGASLGGAIGGAVGAPFAVVGAIPGAAIGSLIGGVGATIGYSFSGFGSFINNSVTDGTKYVIDETNNFVEWLSK